MNDSHHPDQPTPSSLLQPVVYRATGHSDTHACDLSVLISAQQWQMLAGTDPSSLLLDICIRQTFRTQSVYALTIHTGRNHVDCLKSRAGSGLQHEYTIY